MGNKGKSKNPAYPDAHPTAPRARHWREASQGAIRVWFAHPSLDLLPAALIVAIQPSMTGREGPAVTAAPVIAAVGWSVLAPLVLRLDRPMLGFPHGFPTTVYMNFLRLWAVGVLIALLATAGAVWGPTRVGGAAAVVGLTSMTRVSILGWYLARLTRRPRASVTTPTRTPTTPSGCVCGSTPRTNSGRNGTDGQQGQE